jgi:hypothetical protein
MAIQNTAVLTTPTTIYTCPGVLISDPQEHAVTCMIFCNKSSSDVVLNLYAVPNGNTYEQGQIVKDLTIPAGETVTMDTEKIILSTGDTVQAVASFVGRLIATISTVRVS